MYALNFIFYQHFSKEEIVVFGTHVLRHLGLVHALSVASVRRTSFAEDGCCKSGCWMVFAIVFQCGDTFLCTRPGNDVLIFDWIERAEDKMISSSECTVGKCIKTYPILSLFCTQSVAQMYCLVQLELRILGMPLFFAPHSRCLDRMDPYRTHHHLTHNSNISMHLLKEDDTFICFIWL